MKSYSLILLALLLSAGASNAAGKEKVTFADKPNENKVEVFVGGHFFTALIYPDDMEKYVLYPILTASEKTITRGYPLHPRPFERTDHPHHVGLWFNFGDVNGLDFWNNSFAIKPEDKDHFGTIRLKEVIAENPKKGALAIRSEWVDSKGNILLNEQTTFVFAGHGNLRTIEKITRLEAVQQVTFTGNKEGLIGMRLDRAFEEPSDQPGRFLDSNGKVTETPVLNNEGINGVYRNADGVKGTDVWGKRSPWVALRAEKDGEVITIVLMDHPENVNYPAWSHARGYGLFAANNFGGIPFDKNAEQVKVVLEPGQSLTLKHEVAVGGDLSDKEINELADNFGKSNN